MNRIVRARRGFTLVEILIVVIILGILAAIVIPQFTNASQDARKSSLTSQLQTLRSQVSLYALQHRDKYPTDLVAGGTGLTPWDLMTKKTNDDETTTGTPQFGPYLQAAPVNPLNGLSDVVLTNSDFLSGSGNPSSGGAKAGWVFNPNTGKIWATTAAGTTIYDEAKPGSDGNTNSTGTPATSGN